MNRQVSKFRFKMAFLTFLVMGLIFDFPVIEMPIKVPVKEAEARIGRPATPASVAGVHRRTRRRTRRRWAVGTRMYTLPAAYTTALIAGTTYYVVDGEYLTKAYEGNQVTYVVVDDPNNASANKADAQAQPTQAEPVQTQPPSTGTVEQKLLELKNLYDQGLIDKDEYDAKKKEILNRM